MFVSASCLNSSLANTPSDTSHKIHQARQLIQQFMLNENVPGVAVSVAKNQRLIWSEGFGFSNLQDGVPVRVSKTKFRIGSISKPLTAFAMGILVEEKRLDLDASIYAYVPTFPKKRYDFSVRQTAGHTAGIRHYRGREFLLNNKMSIVEGLDIFKQDPLKFEPGSDYSYNSYGWNLLSVVVQNASRTEFNQFMQNKVFLPLNMQATEVDVPERIILDRSKESYWIAASFTAKLRLV